MKIYSYNQSNSVNAVTLSVGILSLFANVDVFNKRDFAFAPNIYIYVNMQFSYAICVFLASTKTVRYRIVVVIIRTYT